MMKEVRTTIGHENYLQVNILEEIDAPGGDQMYQQGYLNTN